MLPFVRPVAMTAAILIALFASDQNLVAGEIVDQGPITFDGEILEHNDLSAAASFGGRLLIGSDEGSTLQVLARSGEGQYRVESMIGLYADSSIEADIEGLTIVDERVYAVGSHGLVRKKVEYPDDSDDRRYERNRERLAEVENQDARNRLFRFSITSTGRRSTAVEVVNLRTVLGNDPVLGRFLSIPGKEGGVDVEGIAAEGETLYVGLRGPILRQNFVPVLKLEFDRPNQYQLIYTNLGGYGIRDLLKVTDGLLIVAGPVGDADQPCDLYFWDGRDCVPGRDREPARLEKLGRIPTPGGGKAEAIALLTESADAWTLVALYDGVERGGARKLRVAR